MECKVFDIPGGKLLTILAPATEAGMAKTGTAGAESGTSATVVDSDLIRDVKLLQKKYVYDLGLDGKFLGKTDHFKLELKPALGRVIACMDEPASKPEVHAPSALIRGEAANITIQNVKNSCHVQVEDPDHNVVFEKSKKEE